MGQYIGTLGRTLSQRRINILKDGFRTPLEDIPFTDSYGNEHTGLWEFT